MVCRGSDRAGPVAGAAGQFQHHVAAQRLGDVRAHVRQVVLEFGLVGQTMHAVDERTSIADLHKLSAIFSQVLDGYFAS